MLHMVISIPHHFRNVTLFPVEKIINEEKLWFWVFEIDWIMKTGIAYQNGVKLVIY